MRYRFSPWTAWQDRKDIGGCGLPGVYVLAHWKRAPRGPANPSSGAVLYIGETCARTLRTRWGEFDRAARGRGGHAGGDTYHGKFHKLSPKLHVAALPVGDMKQPLRSAHIRFIERELLLKYVRRWGRLPKCNKG
jgi:hypothetical protein